MGRKFEEAIARLVAVREESLRVRYGDLGGLIHDRLAEILAKYRDDLPAMTDEETYTLFGLLHHVWDTATAGATRGHEVASIMEQGRRGVAGKFKRKASQSEARKKFEAAYRAGVRDNKELAMACGRSVRTVQQWVNEYHARIDAEARAKRSAKRK